MTKHTRHGRQYYIDSGYANHLQQALPMVASEFDDSDDSNGDE
ncbi:hypothetical protein [Oceanisphaera psychrotolerans]|nr:hypothetical protein [Oceanisphaera psychrotolerans]